MKKMIFTLVALLAFTMQANAMSYEQARNEALFLTDKMAYELNLSDAQYEAAYEINLDYLMSVTGCNDVNGLCWERRNADLRYILYSWQWDAFCAATYFFRPLYWDAGYWHFGVYARYPRRDYFYFGRPHFYASYRGGHSWRMNGGHSYYEHHRDALRPGHVSRDHHVGMRNGWDRGDYRSMHHGNSSTRVTVGNRNSGNIPNSGGWRDNGRSHGSRDNSGYRGNQSHDNSRNSGGFSGGGRSSGSHSSGGFSGAGRSGGSNSDGSYSGGGRSSSHSSGGFSGGGRSGGSSHGGGAPTRGGNDGGSRSSSSRR